MQMPSKQSIKPPLTIAAQELTKSSSKKNGCISAKKVSVDPLTLIESDEAE